MPSKSAPFVDDPFDLDALPIHPDVAAAADADGEESQPAPARKAEPVELTGGTVEVSIPGSAWGHQYGAVRITVPVTQIHNVDKWLAQNTQHVQRTFDVAEQYRSEHHKPVVPTPREGAVPGGGYAAKVPVAAPAAAVSPVIPAQGLGADDVRGLAAGNLAPAGADAGLTQVKGKFGAVVFPTPQAFPKQSFIDLAVQVAAQVLQVPAQYLVAFDNRDDLLSGTAYSDAPGAIKFSKNAPVALQQSVLTRAGKPATLGWVSWSTRDQTIAVKPTKDFQANVMTIAQLLAGGAQ